MNVKYHSQTKTPEDLQNEIELMKRQLGNLQAEQEVQKETMAKWQTANEVFRALGEIGWSQISAERKHDLVNTKGINNSTELYYNYRASDTTTMATYLMQEWDTSTWQQVGNGHWTGHCSLHIKDIVINPACTLVASASADKQVRIWRLSDQKTIAIFHHSAPTMCVTFSIDSKYILSGGGDGVISEWAVPEDANSQACFHHSLTLVT
ncbi:uncharacterized protein BJ212DRAFT_1485921 [Suillus subaureus]|uniref:Uncharacterized protein n=1 Tax=Suillus subaureus TaxID=48587 RepID=A0A9P7J712_9AGAM|nr:uncharacterized protein BJ212DRAFT_1485921 [Suillus subaureus]KAG1806168.1 hypothetical protein BJ212DRAFT_1485921 [Suillus subaureus]